MLNCAMMINGKLETIFSPISRANCCSLGDYATESVYHYSVVSHVLQIVDHFRWMAGGNYIHNSEN